MMGTPLHLLLIEDSEDDALLLVRELRQGGYDPSFQRVETLHELEALLDARPWDAVIADFNLPGFTGLDALRMVREKGLDLPFILVSGVIGEETAVEAMKAGAHDFILKGSYARLVPALERELRETAVRRGQRLAEEQLAYYRGHLEKLVQERTAELQAANASLRDSRRAALNIMEDADNARRQAEEASAELRREMNERKRAEEALRHAHDGLEKRVAERTEELARTVNMLQAEIIEREKSEEALRHSERKYRSLFEESKDVVYIMTAEGMLVDINPAGSELFGYSKEESLALDVARDLYCEPADRERFLRELFARGYVRDFEVCMRKKGREPLHVLNTATVIRNERGEIIGYRGIIHDITDRKRLEQQLLQSQKMESIGLLAGGIAHDFNNLLTAISGYGQIIQDQFAGKDEMLGVCIGQVMAATGRAVELTRNLLVFGRKQIINPQPVSLCDIVVNLSKLLTRIIGEDIEFSTQLSGKELTVMADKGQIDQVLVNLATNARDAMPKGGRLHIRTERVELDRKAAARLGLDKGGAYALLSVADSGVGMDRETLEKIFEPFFTTKETGKGTGLGLSIIYGIVKQHNGAIAVESEPERGTTFTAYLPLVAAAVDAAPEEAPPAPARGTETILLAEDDAMVRKFMQKILEMAGYTVIVAYNGEEAVGLFRDNRDRIALVLCDVVMPKKNGREVYDEIRAMEPHARFLFASGYNDEIIHTKGILHENIELITKPVDRLALLAKLREMLDA